MLDARGYKSGSITRKNWIMVNLIESATLTRGVLADTLLLRNIIHHRTTAE